MLLQLSAKERERIQSAQDIHEIIRKVFYERKAEQVDLSKEHFWTFSLNDAAKILALELVSIGSYSKTIVDPGPVFRTPIYKEATNLILVHNHPSDALEPSEGDLRTTNLLIKAGAMLNIDVIEHVIVGRYSYFSFEINGLINKLRFDTQFAYPFIKEKLMRVELEKMKKQIEKQKAEIKRAAQQEGEEKGLIKGEQRGRKAERMEIAKNLLRQGIDIAAIEQATGITKQWLGRFKNEIQEEKYNH